MNEMQKEVFKAMLDTWSIYNLTVETTYTIHYIERVPSTNRDRGRWKWFAEVKPEYWNSVKEPDTEAHRSHVDHADLFPRYLFLDTSMFNELVAWVSIRRLTVTDIKAI